MKEIKFINAEGNICIAHFLGRNYPGVLVQGDTLYTLAFDIAEVMRQIKAGEHQEAYDIAESLHEKLEEWLDIYVESIKEDYDLPFHPK